MSEARRVGGDGVRHLRSVGGPPSARLDVGDGGELPVAVSRRGEDMLLVPLADPPAELDPAIGAALDDATVEAESPRGLIRMHGRVQRVGVATLRFEADGEPEVVQRRAHFRIAAAQPVRLDDGSATRSLNLSGGGMLLAGPSTLQVGARIGFELLLSADDPRPVVGTGVVVRATPDGRPAVMFERIDPRERERLIRHLFDRQRRARQVRRER